MHVPCRNRFFLFFLLADSSLYTTADYENARPPKAYPHKLAPLQPRPLRDKYRHGSYLDPTESVQRHQHVVQIEQEMPYSAPFSLQSGSQLGAVEVPPNPLPVFTGLSNPSGHGVHSDLIDLSQSLPVYPTRPVSPPDPDTTVFLDLTTTTADALSKSDGAVYFGSFG